MTDTSDAVAGALDALVASEQLDNATAQAFTILARLRRFNRDAYARVNEQRQLTMEARNAMDQTHLKLQNSLYEKRHIEREIVKARQFEFIYQEIPLYDLEEFARIAPEAAASIDEHEVMKGRLELEFSERTRLEERRKQLIVERDRLLKLKKENRVKMDNQSKEENELAKKAANLEKILSDLTIASAAPSPTSSQVS